MLSKSILDQINLFAMTDQLQKKKIFGISNINLDLTHGFIIVLLVFVLVALGERILYDLARHFVGDAFDYLTSLPTIVVHATFIIPLLIVSIIVNVAIGERKQKYAIVLIPYFITSILLAIQLAMQISVYFYNNHTQLQFYVVMVLLVLITSIAIYTIQKRFVIEEVIIDSVNTRSSGYGVYIVIGIILFVIYLFSSFFGFYF